MHLKQGRGRSHHCHPEPEDKPLQLAFEVREGEESSSSPRTVVVVVVVVVVVINNIKPVDVDQQGDMITHLTITSAPGYLCIPVTLWKQVWCCMGSANSNLYLCTP